MVTMVKHDMSKLKKDIPDFKFLSKEVCLDFARTLKYRITDHPQELLTSYDNLVLWGKLAQCITESQAQQLIEAAVQRPAEALHVLKQAIELREAMYRTFLAVAEHSSPDTTDMEVLNTKLASAMSQSCLVQKGDHFVWDWRDDAQALDRMLWPVMRSAADLLTSQEPGTIHRCASPDCSGLFIDTSKNHSRRWCDMTVCGNRAKARRHYARHSRKTLSMEGQLTS